MNNVDVAMSPALSQIMPQNAMLSLVPGVKPLLKRYHCLPLTDNPADFAARSLEALNIKVQVLGEQLAKLPASGPLLLAANHPFGGAEGLALTAQLARIRPDLKILANSELCRIAELRSIVIPVNVFGSKGEATNVSGLRHAMRHVESGGALAVFPAGVVSHWHLNQQRITDPEWNALIGRLARKTEATVIPLYFAGNNSLLFQAAGCLHAALRTALLPHEMWRMRGRNITLHVGKPVEAGVLSSLRDDKARTAHLRACCYALGRTNKAAVRNWPVPVAAAKGRCDILDEVAALPSRRTLAKSENFLVLHVIGKEAPNIMREIGRLREETFRAASEGSGKELDIDRFDQGYSHIVLWDKKNGTIAGGYRARCFFPAEYAKANKTLYSASLFKFKPKFFDACGVFMELGRAFVALNYQRDYEPLLLLWKGIGQLAALVGARTLFGPTSIGLSYSPESILMLRQYLEEQHFDHNLAALVSGKRVPAAFRGCNTPDIRGLEYKKLDRAIKDIEGDKGLPILFKHYLQLGGRIAAFHEDRHFGTMDALIVIDLTTAPEKLLLRYIGEDGLRRLRRAHLATNSPLLLAS